MLTRRDTFRTTTAAAMGGIAAYAQATRGLPPLKITGVRVILTCPPFPGFDSKAYHRLVVVKVETSGARPLRRWLRNVHVSSGGGGGGNRTVAKAICDG